MRRSALPRVWPKPRSSGSATSVAKRFASLPGVTWSLLGRISSCQFFWIVTVSPMGQSILPSKSLALEIADQSALQNSQNHQRGGRAARAVDVSNPPTLARTATIVRDRRHVADRCDGEARGLQCAKRRFAARTGTRDLNLQRAHAVFLRLLGDVFRGDLSRIRGRFARPLETIVPAEDQAMVLPCASVMVMVVLFERRIHVRNARCNVLALTAAYAVASLPIPEPFLTISTPP